MMDITVSPYGINGKITAPPSKSAAHRAVIAAALARGRSVIENVDMSDDIAATVRACEELGCGIRIQPAGRYNVLYIDGGMGGYENARIDCAESGSTLRFMIPVACALGGTPEFTGRGRLPERPIGEYLKIFEAQRIPIYKPYDKNLPLKVYGSLRGGKYRIGGGVSSQYITGLLFALPLLEEDSVLDVDGELESKGYVDMTLDTLEKFGIRIGRQNGSYTVKGNQKYEPRDVKVEGDWSQAAFFIAAAALSGGVTIDGLRGDSLQPDRAIIEIMKRMGARIERSENAVRVEKSALHGIEVDVSQCPDLVPPIAAAAAYAEGTTRIMGAARLRIKESNRLKALCDNLNGLGVKAEESSDSLTVHGGGIKGGKADSFGDHRIAMALSVMAAGAPVTIAGAECVNKSYPGFFEDLKSLGGKVS